MKETQHFANASLNSAGLNRQAIFNIDDLPTDIAASVRASSPAASSFRQLILIGHAGRQLWTSVKAAGIDSEHPIDDFTVKAVRRWFALYQGHNTYEIMYPGVHLIGLQRLGQLAGWHHATPFMLGIDPKWGTWYAYRAVVLADTNFQPTKSIEYTSPCNRCEDKVCIATCPGTALASGQLDLAKCIAYRKQAGSSCKATCLARIHCPVGSQHRYDDEQMHHIYSNSMRFIERYY
jgi:epoxyqueuosine reductase